MKDRGERLNSAPGAVIFLSFSIGRVWRHLFINYIGAAFLSFDFVVFLLREWFKSETKQNKKAENTSQNSSSSSGCIFFFQLLNEGSPIKRWASASLPVMSSFTHPFASRICLFCFFLYFIFCLILPLQYEGRNFDKTDRHTRHGLENVFVQLCV